MKRLREQNGWPQHPWYKKLWKYRYRLAALPLLVMPIQAALPSPPSATTLAGVEAREAYNASVVGQLKQFELGLAAGGTMAGTLLMEALCMTIAGAVRGRKSVAEHELGHVLTVLAMPNLQPKHVEAGSSHGATSRKFYRPEEADDIFLLQQALISDKGGAAMENLVRGWADMGDIGDRWISGELVLKGIQHAQNPKDVLALLRFMSTRTRRTEEILLRFDRKTVDELADKLAQEQVWNRKDIKGIVRQYNLDQVKVTSL